MKFGYNLSNQHLVQGSSVEQFQALLAQARAAKRYGFDSIGTGQHWLAAPFRMFQLVPTLARAIAEAEGLTIHSVFLLPFHNPVALAEDIATLDIISKGRFIFGVALGYRDIEHHALGIPREHRLSRFVEALDVLKRLWTEEEVTHEGRHFHLERVALTLRPVQRPHPPIWIAANNDRAIQRAAQMADAWYLNPHAKLETLEQQLSLYKAALNEAGKPFPKELPIGRELYVAKDRKTAFREARPYLEYKFQTYIEWGQHRALPTSDHMDAPFDELWQDRFIIGGPDECAEEIQRYRDRLGVGHMMFRLHWPGMPAELVLRQMRLLHEAVLPHFRT
ncbi:MAG: LLM class flavin-dependent oxidoreductase [Chloroflexi bacterium]|nr:LLM class flavin-dependent oxidoreductase [Chloroflexota bacterium]